MGMADRMTVCGWIIVDIPPLLRYDCMTACFM
jgi:hypothetical protein